MDGQAQAIFPKARYFGLQNWCIALAVIAAAVIGSYFWLDRPIAFFVHRNVVDKTVFVWLQRLPAWCGLWTLIERPLFRAQRVALSCSISFIATNYLVLQLKYVFGRTWPVTWVDNNPSLIQNGAFGFYPFHGGLGFAAFPSGHVAGVCSVMAVLWWSYPHWRAIYISCTAVVAVGLIGANYHFLSDILSGMFVGTSAGYITTKMSPNDAKNGFLT
jgi:membrane-associated phospholipid phosphatase